MIPTGGPPLLEPVLDPTPADWVMEGRRSWGHLGGMRVGTLVPPVFPSYVRIFCPHTSGKGLPMRWSYVAEKSGRTMHAEAQFYLLAGGSPAGLREHRDLPADAVDGYRGGGMNHFEMDQRPALIELLKQATNTPDDCWICEWDGYGYLAPSVTAKAAVRGENRRYLLYRGSIEDVGKFQQGPEIWWPTDRAWLVATDTDLDSVFVGAEREVIIRLLNHPVLEALEVRPESRFDSESDTINGM